MRKIKTLHENNYQKKKKKFNDNMCLHVSYLHMK